MVDPVHVIAATGRSGQALMRALNARGVPAVAVARNAAKWKSLNIPGEVRVADLGDGPALRQALAGATRIASCAHARYAPAILEAAPADARFVFMGSTQRYTLWPNEHSLGVRRGEEAFLVSGRNGAILHPTMIYGAQGENNVQRLAALLRRLPATPLPGGGKSLVQPIYQDDVTSCLLAALDIGWQGPNAIIIAGPEPIAYADFARAVAKAAGLPKPRIVPVPAAILMALAPISKVLPKFPKIEAAEIRRLLEDKSFPIDRMISSLGVKPIPLEEGLRRMFASIAPSSLSRA